MKSNGYIYVLMNPSLTGVVKIGLTTRDPENRVNELSSATGIPTPFILVYKEYFADCFYAEKQIHSILEQKNYRLSSNREFFTIPIHDAIKLIQNLKSQQESYAEEDNNAGHTNSNDIDELLISVLEEAEGYYYGNDGKLVDYDEAIRLFKQAARMGASKANLYLGNIYMHGNGVKEDEKKAIEYYKQGAKTGDVECFAVLGLIYSTLEGYIHKDNAFKCWESYFSKINEVHEYDLVGNIMDYLRCYLNNGWDILYTDIILKYKRNIENSKTHYLTEKMFKYLEKIHSDYYPYTNFEIISIYNIGGTVMKIKLHNCNLSEGDKILLSGKYQKLKTRVIHIEKNNKFVNSARSGDIVIVQYEASNDELDFFYSGGVITKVTY